MLRIEANMILKAKSSFSWGGKTTSVSPVASGKFTVRSRMADK